jgi:hypothetical protein
VVGFAERRAGRWVLFMFCLGLLVSLVPGERLMATGETDCEKNACNLDTGSCTVVASLVNCSLLPGGGCRSSECGE